MTDEELDAQAREQGWGKVTDAAFNGTLRPLNTESQARHIARWSYDRIARLEKELAKLLGAYYEFYHANTGPTRTRLHLAAEKAERELDKGRIQ